MASAPPKAEADSKFREEIEKRRTFAIISHPDAGKTTLTEKLLLKGGAIHEAGEIKARKADRFAMSDWMTMEKERGISVTSSVMQFPYRGYELNLLDTPGHRDFSEDTYRVLTAADSVIMVLDNANGVEQQTEKLMEVCRMQDTPIITFVNKMDRHGLPPRHPGGHRGDTRPGDGAAFLAHRHGQPLPRDLQPVSRRTAPFLSRRHGGGARAPAHR